MPTEQLKELRAIHAELKLGGTPRNALLEIPDETLAYVLAVLRGERPAAAPNLRTDEWERVLYLLGQHGIDLYFYSQVIALPPELRPPAGICDQLRQALLSGTVQYLQAGKQLKEIVEAFRKEEIRALVLKGLALAETVYPRPELRPFSDMDLLVMPGQVRKARSVLNALGYRNRGNTFDLFSDFDIEERFTCENKNKRMVELHWGLHAFDNERRERDVRDYFQRAIRIENIGLVFDAPDPIDSLVHQAIHVTKVHYCEINLKWVLDIARLIKSFSSPQDWINLQERAAAMGAGLSVEHSLRLARLWFGAKPPALSAWPSPAGIEERMWRDAHNRHRSAFSMLRARGVWGSPRRLLLFLFPPPAYMKEEFPYDHFWQLPDAYLRRFKKWLGKRK